MSKPFNVAALATVVDALKPQSSTGASSFSLTGATIDKLNNGLESALLCVSTGAKSGSPSAVSVQAKLQDSADGSTWADVAADNSPLNPVVTASLDDENQRAYIALVLTPLRRYFRLVFTVTLTGGSSPAILLAAPAVLGGGVSIPPTHA